MKISNLKQPYRRMAEYLAERNTNPRRNDKTFLLNAFDWEETNDLFWDDVDEGNYPEITEEIKSHFPPDFDFSSEEENLNKKYTRLAKEGKFDQLPDTCEFSEAVELEVWDNELSKPVRTNVLGKFKNRYVTEGNLCWKFAKLPIKKIDFSQFKNGDVVVVEYYGDNGDENIVGYIYFLDISSLSISNKMTCYGEEEIILNKNIKSITKIK